MTTEWREIVTSALLGVEKLDPNRSNNGQEAERELLLRAGSLNLRRKTGLRPVRQSVSSAAPAPPDNRPRCSDEVGHIFRYMLAVKSFEIPKIIPEFLRLLASAQLRIADELLPSLLEYVGNYPKWETANLVELIGPVIGKRGLWLAAQNPKWHYVLAFSDDEAIGKEIWETGDIDLRILYLRAVRKRDPARGLAMVKEAWEKAPSKHRVLLPGSLGVKTSMADEPFLEAALDDPDKSVGEWVPETLATLPDSRFVQRMIARGRTLLRWNHDSTEGSIEVTLPELDAEMARDRVDNPVLIISESQGLKEDYLMKILSAIPLDFWEAEWKKTPEEIIRAAKGEWQEALIKGWITALRFHPSFKWSTALFETEISTALAEEHIWLRLLPRPEAEKIAVNYLKKQLAAPYGEGERRAEHARSMIANLRPWSRELTHALLEEFRRYIKESRSNSNWLYFSFSLWVAVNVGIEEMSELIGQLTDMLDTYTAEEIHGRKFTIDEALEIARFRRDMQRAILNS